MPDVVELSAQEIIEAVAHWARIREVIRNPTGPKIPLVDRVSLFEVAGGVGSIRAVVEFASPLEDDPPCSGACGTG